jgi:PIN domain nuclease of toxin-antitoxin system
VDNYLLDTHTAIWFLSGNKNLSQTARQIILDPSNSKCISIASVFELAIKIHVGKLKFSGNSAGFVSLAQDNNFSVMPIEPSYLTIIERLPLIHRDPFDHILIATAIAERMTIITADADIVRYDVPHVW